MKKATAALDRKNNKLKDDERRESVAVDHLKAHTIIFFEAVAQLLTVVSFRSPLQADKQEKEREIEALLGKRDSESQKIAEAEAETESIEREIEATAALIPDLTAQLAAKKKEVRIHPPPRHPVAAPAGMPHICSHEFYFVCGGWVMIHFKYWRAV